MSSGVRGAVALLLAASLVSCYTLEPVQSGNPAVGNEVVVTLTDDGKRAAAEQSAAYRGGSLAGRVLETTEERLLLRLARQQRQQFSPTASAFDTLALPYEHVERVELRRLKGATTALLTFAIVGAAATLSLVWLTDLTSGPGGEDSFKDPAGEVSRVAP